MFQYPYDSIESEIIADRVFESAFGSVPTAGPIVATEMAAEFDNFDGMADAEPDEGDRYVDRLVLGDAETEARFVESLNEHRVALGDDRDDDPAMVASLQRLARTAWIHEARVRAVAQQAEGDLTSRALAAHVVARAHRAASAVARAAARAVTRAAIRARNSARARMVPARTDRVRRAGVRLSRFRAPHVRRVRLSAVASAGSGSEEPSPEPPGQRDETGLPAGRQP